jgi:endonuclease/exonuclease/phosphatase family metal-dependent hydrolase
MEINVLETIERDIIEKYSEKGDIILMGDFNARTGSEEVIQ